MDVEKKIHHVTFDESDGLENRSFEENLRFRLRQVTEHIVFRLVIIILIIADVGVLFGSISEIMIFDYVAFGFSCVFLIEILLRLYGLGLKMYFRTWLNIIDFIVVLVSFISNLVNIILDYYYPTKYINWLTAFRLIRIPRIFYLVIRNKKSFIQSSRYATSENKRRFQSDGFDLDLCYITNRVIAMSFPSSGLTAFYRNSISDVAKFLNTKYGSSYRIYNLCEEKGYDTKIFNDQVERYMITDHNVPRLEDMITFAKSSRKWLAESNKNVIAVHCKGGKGRTGTMICVHLIDNEVFDNAEVCLQYFGKRRTDLVYGKKFQGVETPSQSRYVGYFEKIKTNLNLCSPAKSILKIQKIVLTGVQAFCGPKNSPIWMQIVQRNQENQVEVIEVHFNDINTCEMTSRQEGTCKIIEIVFQNSPIIQDDVKLKFFSSNKKVKKVYDDCAFFFWFHTSFIENNQLTLTREQLDNPHKKGTWKIYGSDFTVDVFFTTVTTI